MVKYRLHIMFVIFSQIIFSEENIKNINVITTNDIHGMLGEQDATFMNPNFPPKIIGFSALYKYLDDIRGEELNDIIVFDGGNFFQWE